MSVKNISLRAQLNIVILLVLILSFLGSAWINAYNTQHFLTAQLESHAQDTATSLGLALSEPLFEKETLVVEATINAIFDRGFYHHIVLEDINGDVLYQRINNNQPEQVPAWFINLFELTAPEQRTMIDTGWTIGGVLKVQAHTGTAYAQLWNSANDFSHATLFIFVLSLFLGYIVLQQVYKPINQIALQAKGIQKRKFILIENMPRARELLNFVLAMNQMVLNIKSTFDELTAAAEKTRKTAYIDPQTGIENRRAFNDNLDALLSESSEHHGHIVMVRVTGLAELNKSQGYMAGDSLIANLIKQINNQMKGERGYKLYRTSGSELCFFINMRQDVALSKQMHSLVKHLSRHIEVVADNKIGLGGVSFFSDDDLAQVMYQLDRATNNAVESSEGYYYINERPSQSRQQDSASSFKKKIETVLLSPIKSIQLKGQKAVSFSEREGVSTEFFASFLYEDEDLNTRDVFATAAQFDLTAELDIAILKQVLALCPTLIGGDEKFAINFSRLTFTNRKAMQQIIGIIKQSQYSNNLVIGLTESAVISSIKEANESLVELTELGCSICINRFGASIESLKYLIEVRPDFVKLDTSFTRNIDSKSDNANLIEDFVRLAHGLNISVVAQCVETEKELNALKSLNVDSVLGYIIEKPKYF